MSILICFAGWLLTPAISLADVPVATVNGQTLSERDVAFLGLLRGIDLKDKTARESAIRQLIDRQLVRQFLDKRKIAANADTVDLQVQQLEELVRRRDGDPKAVFAKLGVSTEQVRSELSLPLAWQAYVEQTVTPDQIRKHFDEHRAELDGTRVHVLHLFRKATSAGDVAAAETLLKTVRGNVEQKQTTFAAAVKQHSQSPSASDGGDVGWIVGRGKLPDELTTAALKLQPGELAGPIRTPFGVHLIQVTEREPGQLSPEDARPQILTQLSDQMWSRTVADERSRAKIIPIK
ncbi:MAG TPA: peptidylprolyl isomerase [Planctomycetaceae bacterium]|nr:peptidylprolyl isomerase [Planctomycetaceae bacterium]